MKAIFVADGTVTHATVDVDQIGVLANLEALINSSYDMSTLLRFARWMLLTVGIATHSACICGFRVTCSVLFREWRELADAPELAQHVHPGDGGRKVQRHAADSHVQEGCTGRPEPRGNTPVRANASKWYVRPLSLPPHADGSLTRPMRPCSFSVCTS